MSTSTLPEQIASFTHSDEIRSLANSLMHRSYIELGSAPLEVHGHPDSKYDCERYKRMMEYHFPVPPGVDATYIIQLTIYRGILTYSLVISYSELSEDAHFWATHVEGQIPRTWDQWGVVP